MEVSFEKWMCDRVCCSSNKIEFQFCKHTCGCSLEECGWHAYARYHTLSLSLSLSPQHILSHLPRKFLDDWERNWILINKFRHRIVMENICPRVHFENRLDVKILINSFLFCFLNEFLSRTSTSPLLLILANGSHFLLHFFLIFLHRNYASLCDTLTRMEGLITNNSASRVVSWPTFNFLYFDNFRDVWNFILQQQF